MLAPSPLCPPQHADRLGMLPCSHMPHIMLTCVFPTSHRLADAHHDTAHSHRCWLSPMHKQKPPAHTHNGHPQQRACTPVKLQKSPAHTHTADSSARTLSPCVWCVHSQTTHSNPSIPTPSTNHRPTRCQDSKWLDGNHNNGHKCEVRPRIRRGEGRGRTNPASHNRLLTRLHRSLRAEGTPTP